MNRWLHKCHPTNRWTGATWSDFRSSLVRRSCSVTPWPGQLWRSAPLNYVHPISRFIWPFSFRSQFAAAIMRSMKLEDTKSIIEIAEPDEVNDYLQLGWVLINQYIIDVGELRQPSQRSRFVLAWQNADAPAPHPDNSTYLQNQRMWERMKIKSIGASVS